MLPLVRKLVASRSRVVFMLRVNVCTQFCLYFVIHQSHLVNITVNDSKQFIASTYDCLYLVNNIRCPSWHIASLHICLLFLRLVHRGKLCTKHNGRQLGSKVFICNKLDVSKHPRSTLQHVMLNAAAMYRPVQCPAVNTQYYMIYYYISL